MNKYKELTNDIKKAYETSVTLEEAERLAAKFLGAQIDVGEELRSVDLDCRMKKTGVKALRAGVYMNAATAVEKKPSDVLLEAVVNMDKMVADEQRDLDEAEVRRDELYNYLNVFKEAHIFFRSISRGRFE